MARDARLQDDPVIQGIVKGVDKIQENQEKFQKKMDEYLLDPEKGLFTRVKTMEDWQATVKKWGGKILFAIILALLTGGGILGFKVTFGE